MSKVTTYYAQTDFINDLCEHYGARFEKISEQDKRLMLAAIALYHAFPAMQKEDEWAEIVLESIDPENDCEDSVREAIEVLLTTEDKKTLTGLSVALAEQLSCGCYAKD